ncbi:hypothetical protein [Streptomyces sp. LN245]|uniref:hypothetical protein n=1 Tax=Streptomyces sp. LN245 TaxID=3112975 RepID=UPI0037229CF4
MARQTADLCPTGMLNRLSMGRGIIERMTYRSSEALSTLAHQHLSAEMAERWVRLLRPAVRLEAAGPSDVPVGHLGGSPKLSAHLEWPQWEDHEPLSFVGSKVVFSRCFIPKSVGSTAAVTLRPRED